MVSKYGGSKKGGDHHVMSGVASSAERSGSQPDELQRPWSVCYVSTAAEAELTLV
jgi:hypothetical protein